MKKVAFFTSDISTFGGTQTVVTILSNLFIKKLGYEVYIISLNEKNKVKVNNLNESVTRFVMKSYNILKLD